MKSFQDQSPSISLTVLGTLCFLTLIMCQTRFKISKEISQDFQPPVLRTRDSWFLYSIGNPDRFKCVLKAFIVITSPIISLISTALLLFGKIESNPYFFIPWLFLTIKGLVLIQMDNLITIIREIYDRQNFILGFRLEDMKWFIFYSSIFMIDMVEVFSFCEIFDLFLVLWNHHPGYNALSGNLEAMKKEIADIMETLSKCSLGNLSKISFGSDSDNTSDCLKKEISLDKLSENSKEKEKLFQDNDSQGSFLKGDITYPKKTDLENKNISVPSSLKSVQECITVTLELPKTDNLVSEADLNENEVVVLKEEKIQEAGSQKLDVLKEDKVQETRPQKLDALKEEKIQGARLQKLDGSKEGKIQGPRIQKLDMPKEGKVQEARSQKSKLKGASDLIHSKFRG